MPRYEGLEEWMIGTTSLDRDRGIPVDKGDLLAKDARYAGIPKGTPTEPVFRDKGESLAGSIARNDPELEYAGTCEAVTRHYEEIDAKARQITSFASLLRVRIKSLTEP